MNSGGGAGGYVWLVTDALGRLGVVATYGAGTLLVAERRQSQLTPDGMELGGIYKPATPPSPPAPTRHAAKVRALSTSARVSAHRSPANVWSDEPPAAAPDDGDVMVDPPAALDALGRTLYPLFCVSVHEHAWMAAGYGVWGLETYLERFWTCLDWAAVRDAYARYAFRK